MMNCHRAVKKLSAYLDRELNSRDRELIESHLEACETCRRELAAMRADWGSLKSLPRVEAPGSMELKVLKRLPVKDSPATLWANGMLSGQPARAAAVIALIIGIGIGVLMGQGLYSSTMAPQPQVSQVSVEESFSFDDFSASTPDSFTSMFSDIVGEEELG